MAYLLEFTQAHLNVLEDEIKKKAILRVRKKGIWPVARNYPFHIHILNDAKFSINVDSGTIVHVYISGLNIHGGDYSILEEDFWLAMDRALKVIPQMVACSDLVAISSVAHVYLKEVQGESKKFATKKGPQIELANDTGLQYQSTVSTYIDKHTGIVLKVIHNLQTHETQVRKMAQIELTKLIRGLPDD